MTRARWGVALIGLCFAAIGGLFQAADQFEGIPVVWPTLFASAALSCWWFAVRPWSSAALIWSEVLCVVACWSRCVAVIENIRLDNYSTSTRGIVGMITWPLTAYLIHRLWRTDIAALHVAARFTRED